MDLEITEEEMYCLTEKYRDLLTNKDTILMEFKKDKVAAHRLFGVLTDLYVDWFKLKGLDVKQKIPDLLKLLEDYSYEHLMGFFNIDLDVTQ